MNKFIIFVTCLVLSLTFVSSQVGNLGVPTSYPSNPLYSTQYPTSGGYSYGNIVDNAGDVNGDGQEDLLIFTGHYTNYLPSTLYVIDGQNGITIHQILNISCADIESLGDINGDLKSEFMCATLINGGYPGGVNVYDGATANILYSVPLPQYSSQSTNFGTSMTHFPDITGDGLPDFAVSDPQANSYPNFPLVYFGSVSFFSGFNGQLISQVYSPNPSPASIAYWFGGSIAAIPDVTGDGLPEFLISETRNAPNQALNGSVYMYSFPSIVTFNTTPPNLIYNFTSKIPGNKSHETFGTTVKGGSDFNNDGFSDIFIGEIYFTNDSLNQGSIYIYSGQNFSQIGQIFGHNTLGYVGSSFEVGDFNGDGNGDIASLENNPTKIEILSGATSGNSIYSYNYPATYGVFASITQINIFGNINNLAYFFNIYNIEKVDVRKLGGVYSYGVGTLTASWTPLQNHGSIGTIRISGFSAGQQVCIGLSGSPQNPGAQLPSGDYVYINPNDPAFSLDCSSLTADIFGQVVFPNVNIQSSSLAGTKLYAQAATSTNGQWYTSNALEITFLP